MSLEAVINPTPQQQCFLDANGLTTDYLAHAQKWFMPIIGEIAEHQKGAKQPLLIGINGSQGSGKSTLADYLKLAFSESFGLRVAAMSMDDFYLSKAQRQQLGQSIHPMLATRGVPGTHNTEQMAQVLADLQAGKATAIPRFNKAIDDPFDTNQWTQVDQPVDIIIMEGWCWATPGQRSEQLLEPVNQLERVDDADGNWRRYVNSQVINHYQTLYDQTDIMLMLKAPSFSCVKQWRLEQEQKLAARLSADDDRSGLMNEQQIETFISYFQRLTEHGFDTLPARSDVVWQLEANRAISTMSRPKEKQ